MCADVDKGAALADGPLDRRLIQSNARTDDKMGRGEERRVLEVRAVGEFVPVPTKK